jgi:hypothetical protein
MSPRANSRLDRRQCLSAFAGARTRTNGEMLDDAVHGAAGDGRAFLICTGKGEIAGQRNWRANSAADLVNACRSSCDREGHAATMLANDAFTSTRVQQWVQRVCSGRSKFEAGNDFPKLACSIIIRGFLSASISRQCGR